MNLAARYSAQNSAWYVTDTTGAYEIDSDVYDTEDEAKADFRYYEGMYAGEQKHQDLTDEEWHDMPLTGQDTPGPTCTRPDCRNPRSCVHPVDLTTQAKATPEAPELTGRAQVQRDLAEALQATPLSVYLLRRADCDWQEMSGCVVIAHSEDKAREMAADNAKDEGAGAWWMPSTAVTRLGPADPEFTEPWLTIADVLEV